MIRVRTLFSALSAVTCLFSSASTQAGLLGCGCSRAPVHHAPMVYAAPQIDAGCECAAAVPSCCGYGGVGGGVAQLGGWYGSAGFYGIDHDGSYGHAYGHSNGHGHGYGSGGGYYGSPDPRSFESGFENLPNMDGGGVHHRLPFHSYRRPWAHPGIADTNINIVW